MKFSKQLKNVSIWNHHYIPFQKLKRKLRNIFSPNVSPQTSLPSFGQGDGSATPSPHSGSTGMSISGDFLVLLEKEIEKANRFIIEEKLNLIQTRFEDLKTKYKSIDISSPFAVYLRVTLLNSATTASALQQQQLESLDLDQSSSSLGFFSEQQQQLNGYLEVDSITAFQIAFEDIIKQLAEIDHFSQLNIQAIQKLLNTYMKKKVKYSLQDQKRRRVSLTETTIPKPNTNTSGSNTSNTLQVPQSTNISNTNTSNDHINIKQEIDKFFNDKVSKLEIYTGTLVKKLTLETELEYQSICQSNLYLLNNSFIDILSNQEKELSKKVTLFCQNVVSNNIQLVNTTIQEIKELMKSLNIKDDQVMWRETIHSCIHKSCYLGNTDMIDLLFSSFSDIVDIHYCDEKNKQFIHIASENGKVDVVTLLLDKWGANIECNDFLSRKPLHLSTKGGHHGCVQLLLSKGALVNPIDREGCTPLYLACRQQKPNALVIELLLKYGALFTVGPYGRHPLHEAASRGNPENIAILFKLSSMDANVVDNFGRTPLFDAIRHGRLESISLLLTNGAKVSVFDEEKRTPLHESAYHGQKLAMEILFDSLNQVDDKDLINSQDDDGWTPLHDAAYLNYTGCVRLLLENGSNPFILDKGEWTPIVHSTYRGNIQTSIIIIEYLKTHPELNHESLPSTPRSLGVSANAATTTTPPSSISPPFLSTNPLSLSGSSRIQINNYLNTSSNINIPSTIQEVVSPTSSGNSGSLGNSSNTDKGSSPSNSKKILKSLMSKVTFRITSNNIKPGYVIGVVGNRKAIGSWNPSSALIFKSLSTSASGTNTNTTAATGTEESIWIGKVSVPVNVQLEYKYIVFDGSRLDTWEALPENRKFTPQEEEEFVDDGVFGKISIDQEQEEQQQEQQQQQLFTERGWLVQDTQLRIRFGETSATDPQRVTIQPVQLYNGKEQAGKIITTLRDRFSNIIPNSSSFSVSLPINKDQSVFFQTNQFHLAHVVQFDIYRRGMSSVLIGRATAFVSEMVSDNPPYKKKIPIINSSLVNIGELLFFPLVISPFTHPRISDVFSKTYWKSTLLIGHRGGGAENARNVGKYKRTHIKENTILSFVTAASLGAQYIEFDVQLSKDFVPVIYHDFEILSQNNIKMPINKLTLEQFKNFHLSANDDTDQHDKKNGNGNGHKAGINGNSSNASSAKNKVSLSRRGRSKSMQDIFNDNDLLNSATGVDDLLNQLNQQKSIQMTTPATSIQSSPPLESHHHGHHGGGRGGNPISDSMTTLEETFKNVPIQCGFNIEIKYPSQEKEQELSLHTLDRNRYVDIILKVVFEHAGDRSVMFSSFDPDICIICSLKQPKYPVFFLNNAGLTQHSDPRLNSISEAIRFSKSAHLLGIVTNSKILVEAPPIIGQVKSAGLMLCSWGAENNDPALVDLQETLGCDAVIVDHVAYVSKHYNSNTNNNNNNNNTSSTNKL
ncbi:hypothetical protein CYY_002335 [Polysphondylium violaceum]|uniref:Glycerophosphodiester phosphodiesterase n=1 Tax=Polysphondylium violaceum TaxID=133409 RepID=A0A8J4V302_9MYCE|nr:hypothetical protein CYY_002335 [Polysphondylium violaceum]